MDTLRVEANERVDFGDFSFATGTALNAAVRVAGEHFLTNPSGSRGWILSGFAMTNPTGKQLTVSLGRALLSTRIDGVVQHGYLAAEGDLSRTIDMTGLSPAVYTVYVRFELIDGANSSRIFWNPSGSGSEYAATIPTRRQANWSVRVETSSPGVEWLAIGTADNSGVGVAIVDQRKFYFEGSIDSTFASGWSSDGGGGANDRHAARETYGISDLQTFTAAMRQCLEDIKGRGLRRWWSRDIGGMNIGFDAAPVEDRLAVGNSVMFLQWDSNFPYWQMDTGDSITYDRVNNYWQFKVGTTVEAQLGSAGLAVTNGLYVGSSSGSPIDNEGLFEGGVRVGTGLYVGSLGTVPTDNKVYAEGDVEAGAYLRAAGRMYLGSDDYLIWDGTNWDFVLNGVTEARVTADGLAIRNGLYVGAASGTPVDNKIYAEGDVEAGGYLRSLTGAVYLGDNDYISYDGTNDLNFFTQGALKMRLGAYGLGVARGLYVGDIAGDAGDNNIYAEGVIEAATEFKGLVWRTTTVDTVNFDAVNHRLNLQFNSINRLTFTQTDMYPSSTYNLGTSTYKINNVHAYRGFFTDVSSYQPTTAYEACSRNGMNNVFAWGKVQHETGGGGSPILSTNHWNVTSVAYAGGGYDVTFDVAPADDSAVLVTVVNQVPASAIVGSGYVNAGVGHITLYNTSHGVTYGNFSFCVIGRPASAP